MSKRADFKKGTIWRLYPILENYDESDEDERNWFKKFKARNDGVNVRIASTRSSLISNELVINIVRIDGKGFEADDEQFEVRVAENELKPIAKRSKEFRI